MTRAPGSEHGFTLVEVLVAMVLALIVVVAILGTLDKANSTSLAQQRDTQAVSIGEGEIERALTLVKQHGFSNLALSSAPAGVVTTEVNPTDPNAFVTGSSFRVLSSWHDTASAPVSTATPAEPLIVAASTAGGVDRLAPGPSTFQLGASGGTGPRTATVNRYVMRRSDPSCPAASTACADDSRRVVVAVRIARNGQEIARTTPLYFSTIVNSGVPTNQANGSGGLAVGVDLP